MTRPTPEEIAIALSDCLEPIGTTERCGLCGELLLSEAVTNDEHAARCPWRMAKEWRHGASS